MKKYIAGGLAVLIFAVGVSASGAGKFFKFADNPTVYKAYQSAEEFLQDGGVWGEIQTFNEPESFRGVNFANEYHYSYQDSSSSDTQQISTLRGALGSVVNFEATSGGFVLYDATTSDITKRALATTSLPVLAKFPAGVAVGTYVFDTIIKNGLLAVFTAPNASSTITYR